MSAIVDLKTGVTRQLDRKVEPKETVSPEDVKDPEKLARLLTRLLEENAEIKRRFAPRSITFRNIVATGTTGSPHRVRLLHRFGGPVDFELVGVKDAGLVQVMLIQQVDGTDGNTLVLDVYFEATIAIRVTEAG